MPMWWKIGIGLFFLITLRAGGDLAVLFIGVPLGIIILFGTFILHEKIFEGKKSSESILSSVSLIVMSLGAVLFSFWLIINIIR